MEYPNIATYGDNKAQTDSSVASGSRKAETKPDTDVGSANSEPSATLTPSSVHTHSYSVKTIAATCVEEGYTLKSCVCGHSEKSARVSALGHGWGDWTTVTQATATSTGLKRRTCVRCGATDEQILEKLTTSSSELEQEILHLVNAERAKNGLNALQYYYAGQSAADIRASEIDTVFDHTRPNGTSCFTVLDEAGIRYRGAGENIAKGYPTAEAVMQSWMNSDGHRKNILNANFTHLIVGVNGKCWVQLFLTI